MGVSAVQAERVLVRDGGLAGWAAGWIVLFFRQLTISSIP